MISWVIFPLEVVLCKNVMLVDRGKPGMAFNPTRYLSILCSEKPVCCLCITSPQRTSLEKSEGWFTELPYCLVYIFSWINTGGRSTV